MNKKETNRSARTACVTLNASAKINLALDVIGKHSLEGYREVAMIMQSISLFDTITLEEAPGDISLTVDNPDLTAGQTNLAYRAALLLKEYCRVDKGVKITIEKRIPLAAGLAGGSTDAAATLLGLAKLWKQPLGLAELFRLGADLGSDVPFCLRGGTMMASGRGELVTPLPSLPKCYIILAKPPLSVSTAWVYGNFCAESAKNVKKPNIAAMSECLKNGNLKGVAENMGNVLEAVTAKAYPQITLLKEMMLAYGAMAALMSGSGPTVFGLVQNEHEARSILEKIQNQTECKCETYLTETCDSHLFWIER